MNHHPRHNKTAIALLAAFLSIVSLASLTPLTRAGTTIITNKDNLASGATAHVAATYDIGSVGLTLGAGDTLSLGGYVARDGNPNNVPVNITGNGALVINSGGVLDLQKAWKNSSDAQGSAQYNIGGALILNNGGVLNFGADSTLTSRGYEAITDALRISVGGNLTLNGGTFTSSANIPQIWLKGATNTIASSVSVPTVATFVLNSANQTLTSGAGLGTVLIRQSSDQTATLSVTGTNSDGSNVQKIQFYQQNSGKTTTLKLGSDIRVNENISLAGGPANTAGNTATYTIDTNGRKLDMSASGSRFEPTRNNTNVATTWNFIGNGGTVEAHSFRFNMNDNVSVNIGAGVTLIAHANNVTNTLGSQASGSVDATSTFIYEGADTTSKSFLNANIAIGKVVARKGTIEASSALNIQGGLVIEAGGSFSALAYALTTPSLTFGIDGASFGTISATGAVSIADKTLTFDFAAAPASSTSYTLFTSGATGSADSVSVTFSGLNAIALTNSSGVWSAIQDGFTYTFTESNGILSVASAIPEPSTVALIAGVGSVLFVLIRRRKS
ncbi:PEP-CTERM sorting domain-containing protein [Geminisphaera colitermitum]|uniref:PEP-CTERM sorting domain-containing protein n=1 Tax=Geminisphaera colitermitum TaxID=1148786 RepID=UPI000158D50A|nr:PEP-CTERM sorting domain-containing protein [Geminisphaera colitermitum]